MRLRFPTDNKSAPILFLILALVAALSALAFRATQVMGTDLFHPSLWGEDGTIFLNGANELGFISIVKPYAGYMHLIPRLAAYVTSFFPLTYAPLLFHLAWVSSFIAFVWIVHSRLATIGVPAVLHVWALVLLVVQPQAGEVFFTLTNIQWFVGLALVVYLILPFSGRIRAWQVALVCAAGLTGPFSILATPVLVLRALIFKDVRANLPVYLSVVICALIQAAFIISSPRVLGEQASAAGAGVWLSALVKFLSFGGEYPLATVFAFVYWAAMPWHRIFRAVMGRFHASSVNAQQIGETCAFVLIVVAFGMMLVGFLRDDPRSMGPVILPNGAAGGSRYYLIPYSLLILAAVVSTYREYTRAIVVLAALSVICMANFVRPERSDFQWHAYSKLARIVPNLAIPIAPRIEGYPGWSVEAGKQYDSHVRAGREVLVPLADVAFENGEVSIGDGGTVLRSTSDNFLVTFPVGRCYDSQTIGLEVTGRRDFGGWVHVLWAGSNGFNDKDSVLRYYPAGAFRGYFAFDRKVGQDSVRIRPGFVSGNIEVSGIRMFCQM